ncbi:glycosyltransferase family 39 protein [Clostridium sp. MSJ-8]|uniref:ArnT family glycosyltransferase n=1 Tax=Clostridium sp. MSJ-8 TaxID=2841510 RepID=UPI001C0EE33B|nr:glycosyltransferase family 39 protein [Clostridium sp. MSJ-8]MBU5486805.1 glycosyltransferase family 39 protein [Clostridium sp. MSJ-8]
MKKIIRNRKKDIYAYVGIFLSIIIAFFIAYSIGVEDNVTMIETVMIYSILIIICISIYMTRNSVHKINSIIKMVIIIGIIMRIGYMLYTPCNIRSHDLWGFDKSLGGHSGYIMYILDGSLPDSNFRQYYHPPLFYALSAFMIKIINPILKEQEMLKIIDIAKIVSCTASCYVLMLTYKISKEIKLGDIGQLLAVTIIAFLPNFYLLAGRVNNDSLAIFFMVLAILYTIKWYREVNVKNTVVLAMVFGFGMMTKISVSVVAIFTGIVMLIKGYNYLKNGQIKTILLNYLLFGIIALPLGLWYPMRNLIKFKQPFNYVLDINAPNSAIYCGNHSIIDRLFKIPFSKMFKDIYNNPFGDYNITIYSIKSALFGEFKFDVPSILPRVLLGIFIIFNIFVIISLCITIKSKVKNKSILIAYIANMILQIGAFISFNIRYPYGCTMDYRYIVPTAIFNALLIGYTSTILEGRAKVYKIYNYIACVIIVTFSIFSIVMYTEI